MKMDDARLKYFCDLRASGALGLDTIEEGRARQGELLDEVIRLREELAQAAVRTEVIVSVLCVAREVIDSSATDTSYGFFSGGDPREFSPDPESCTPKEFAAHKAACEAWDRGERPDLKPSGRVETFVVAEHTNKVTGETIPAHRATGIVCGSPFGPGTYQHRDPFLANVVSEIDQVLAAVSEEKVDAPGEGTV